MTSRGKANLRNAALRCLGERANSLLKTTFKALRRWRGCPGRIGQILAAALVVSPPRTRPHHLTAEITQRHQRLLGIAHYRRYEFDTAPFLLPTLTNAT